MLRVNIPKTPLLKRLFRRGKANQPKIVGLFSFRYDHHLVADLLENVSPFIDGWISWDDRERTTLWYHEGEIRQTLINAAREQGADWVLCIDPDERFERSASEIIPALTMGDRHIIWGFPLRELFAVNKYRVDGIWGEKKCWRLFALNADQQFMNNNVHSAWYPINPGYSMQQANVNVYHLKMIDPEARTARAELYKQIDSHGIQEIGYDYLTDETGMILEEIPHSRIYNPFRWQAPVICQTGT